MDLFDHSFGDAPLILRNLSTTDADTVRELMTQVDSVAGRQNSLTVRVGQHLADVLRAGFGRLVEQSSQDRHEITVRLDNLSDRLEGLGTIFHWAMGAIVWRQELQNEQLASILASIQAPLDTAAKELRSRADFAYQQGWYDEAIEDYREAGRKNYQDFTIHRSLGHLFLDHLHDEKGALDYFRKAAKYARPHDPRQAAEAHLFAGWICFRAKDYEGASRDFSCASGLDPSLHQAVFWYAKCKAKAGEADPRIVEPLERAIRADSRFFRQVESDGDLAQVAIISQLLARLEEESRQSYGKARDEAAKILGEYTLPGPLEDELKKSSELEPGTYSELRGALDTAKKALWRFFLLNDKFVPDTNLSGHSGPVTSLAFSQNMQWLASGGKDNSIRLWDVKGRRPVPFLPTLDGNAHHSGGVTCVAFSPDGNLLASGSRDPTAWLWDVAADCPRDGLMHSDGVASIAFSPDGLSLASASRDGSVRVWDVRDGSELQRHQRGKCGACCVAFSPDGKMLAAGWADGKVRVWTATTADARVPPMEAATGSSVRSIAFSPNGRLLISGCKDEKVRVWEIDRGSLLAYDRDEANIWGYEVGISADGKVLATGGRGKHSICVWRRIRPWEQGGVFDECRHLDHHATVSSLVVSPDGRFLASASRVYPTVSLWRRGFRTKAESDWIQRSHDDRG